MKLTDDNRCKPSLIAMLESLEKMVKDFKEAGHEEDVWERIQLAKREPRARSKMKVNRLKNMDISPYVYIRFVASHGRRPNHDEIPQYYVRQLIGEFILNLNVDYTNFGLEFYRVGKGRLADHQYAQRRIPRPIPQPPVAQFLVMAHPEVVGCVSHHLTRVSETIHEDMHHTLHSMRGIVSSQTGPIGPSHSGGDCVDSRPSHGDRSRIPWYVSNDESFLESSVATAYERVGGEGPSREFEEPQTVQIKHFEQPSMDLPSCTATPKTTTCPDTTPMVSKTYDFVTSPLGVEVNCMHRRSKYTIVKQT
eukprot:Gb_02554 [translate_table: standard]